MDHEKLIECVKKFDFLYNQEDQRYSDNEKKETAWKEIGKMLNTPGKFMNCLILSQFNDNKNLINIVGHNFVRKYNEFKF